MLHPTPVSQPTSVSPAEQTGALTPIAGGEAWVVPFEPGGPVWITAGAPQIRVTDRRVRPQALAAAAGR